MVKKMKQMKKAAIMILVMSLILGLWQPVSAQAAANHTDYTPQELLDVIEGIVNWQKEEEYLSEEENLLDAVFLQDAVDNSSVDWLVFGMGRSGYPDDYAAYQAVAAQKVSERYEESGGMDQRKATEWQRTALAILAAGGDPTAVSTDKGTINLVADGTYAMKNGLSPGEQGLNGWIFALLTLDAMRYQVPEGSSQTRESILTQILMCQLSDGGFALDAVTAEDRSDVDMTAMTIQALAPYYNSEQSYTYERMGVQVTQTVRQTVDEALECLSKRQESSGGYVSMGFENCESCCQVIVALCSLGIDPGKDERFIKDGVTVLDALMSYRMRDGGFIHSREYDEENPDADPEKSNFMASGQVCYALTALCRYYGGLRSLYDFREEPSQEVKELISEARTAIQSLGGTSDAQALQAAYEKYLAVPVSERCYVYEYSQLADQMKTSGLENHSESLAAAMEIHTGGSGAVTSLFGADLELDADITFDKEDAEAVDSLPQDVTTENYIEVVKLLDKLNKSGNKEDYQDERAILEKKKEEIAEIQDKIKEINDRVLKELYPLKDLSLEDEDNVKEIQEEIDGLSKYDRQQILQYEDIEEAAVRIKNLKTARLLTAAGSLLVVVILIVVFFRIRSRRAKKKEERQVRYDEEDDEDDEEEQD